MKKCFAILLISIVGCNYSAPNYDEDANEKAIQQIRADIEASKAKKIEDERKKIEDERTSVFNERDKNLNNLFFLHFWPGMSRSSYKIILDSLISVGELKSLDNKITLTFPFYVTTKKLDGSQYLSRYERLYSVRPIFFEISLVQINLHYKYGDFVYSQGGSDDIIELYSKKYGNYTIHKSEPKEYIKVRSVDPLDFFRRGELAYSKEKHYDSIEYIWSVRDILIVATEIFELKADGVRVYKGVEQKTYYSKPYSLTINYYDKSYHVKKRKERQEREKSEADEEKRNREKLKRELLDII